MITPEQRTFFYLKWRHIGEYLLEITLPFPRTVGDWAILMSQETVDFIREEWGMHGPQTGDVDGWLVTDLHLYGEPIVIDDTLPFTEWHRARIDNL